MTHGGHEGVEDVGMCRGITLAGDDIPRICTHENQDVAVAIGRSGEIHLPDRERSVCFCRRCWSAQRTDAVVQSCSEASADVAGIAESLAVALEGRPPVEARQVDDHSRHTRVCACSIVREEHQMGV